MERNIVIIVAKNAAGKLLMHMRDSLAPRNPMRWAFFAGGIEGDEQPLEAAIREFKEETNIDARGELALVGTYVEDQCGSRHVFVMTRPVSWAELEIGEGAGAGFFTHDEIDLLAASGHLSTAAPKCLEVLAAYSRA